MNWQNFLITAPCITTLVLLVQATGLFQLLEWATLDQFLRLRPSESLEKRILIVTVDDSDFKHLGQSRVSDITLNLLINKLKDSKPAAIGLSFYRNLPIEPGHLELQESMQATQNLIGVEKRIGKLVAPYPILEELGQVGFVDFVVDGDGKIRRALLWHEDAAGTIKWSFAAKLALGYLESQAGITPEFVKEKPNQMRLGKALFSPLASNDGGYVGNNFGSYQLLLNYRGQIDHFPHVSLTQVLEQGIQPELVSGRIVLIGSIAASLNEFFYTPYDYCPLNNTIGTPAIVIHANIISQILSSALDKRPLIQTWGEPREGFWIAFWSLVGATLPCHLVFFKGRNDGKIYQWLVTGVSIILNSSILMSVSYLAFLQGWWLPVIPSLCTLSITMIAANVYRTIQLEQENRNCLNQFLESAKKQNSQLAIQKATAEAASRAKSQLLAQMSHELRTPLNIILGYAHIWQQEKNLTWQQKESIDIINNCSEHLLTLINDILDFSKTEVGKMQLQPHTFVLPNLLRGVTEMFRLKAQQKNLTFRCYLPTSLPNAVYADERRLRQVLLNLLSNAIKFTDSGSVTFTVTVVEELPDSSYQIRFQVEDTGIGLTPEQKTIIFLPFEQVEQLSQNTEGTGLGLTISQQIIQMMGGMIQLESNLGQGSKFWFELTLPVIPANIKLKTGSPEGAIVGYRGSVKQILVVVQSHTDYAIIHDLLEPLGFYMLEASNLQSGLEKALEYKPDLIIIDLRLPSGKIRTMISQIQQSLGLGNVVILGSYSHSNNFNKETIKAWGFNDLISQPLNYHSLLNIIAQSLSLTWKDAPQITPELELEATKADDFVVPPTQELLAAYQAAQIGNIVKIKQEAWRLKQLDSQYLKFANLMLALAKEFEDEAILELIEPYIYRPKPNINE